MKREQRKAVLRSVQALTRLRAHCPAPLARLGALLQSGQDGQKERDFLLNRGLRPAHKGKRHTFFGGMGWFIRGIGCFIGGMGWFFGAVGTDP